MLKIIFGNVARKDHYNLSKSNTKKKKHLALKVTEKIKRKKKRSVGSGWTQDQPEADPNIRPELDPSIHPTRPRPSSRVGWVGWAYAQPYAHNAQSSYLPCKAQSYVTFKKKKKEKKKA